MTEVYNALKDEEFSRGYIDIEEDRIRDLKDGSKVTYHYMHGGFEGTDVRFSYCFPRKEVYKERFFQHLSPFPGPEEELASLPVTGEDDKVGFAITHGAYFVETNMGSKQIFTNSPDKTLTHRSNAATAEFSREMARKYYGYDHRPYGYAYGGSGGGYRTMACIENTNAFDGAVPFVIGSPYAIPNCQSTRAHAERLLRDKMDVIIDAYDAGGSGDPYPLLDEEEAAALKEVTLFGYPKKAWYASATLDDGSFPVIYPGVKQRDPQYFEDFWKVKGYLGADPNGSAVRERIYMETNVSEVPNLKKKETEEKGIDTRNGVNDAWKKQIFDSEMETDPWIALSEIPKNRSVGKSQYLKGLKLIVRSGKAEGKMTEISRIEGNKVYLKDGFGTTPIFELLSLLEAGDKIFLDNSDYIAMQTYHRHQVPSRDYHAWDQFRDESGKPLYPQQKELLGPGFSGDGPGCKQNGEIQGKVIILACLMDEQAYPWQADWYRRKVASVQGGNEEDYIRMWYFDNATHGGTEEQIEKRRCVTYTAGLEQALLDLSDWVERGIAPALSTNYTVNGGDITVPEHAKERRGLQPVVKATANESKCAYVKAGEVVQLLAEAEVPDGVGAVTGIDWIFENEKDFTEGVAEISEDGKTAKSKAMYTYTKPGTYFAVARVRAERNGDKGAIFTQVRNIDRVRIIVE